MKKQFFAAAAAILAAAAALTVYADDITVIVDGKTLRPEEAPQIVNERTMLPMRAIFEALGADVEWFGADRIIFATLDSKTIILKIGEPVMSVHDITDKGKLVVELDTAPYIYNDRTFVPARAIAEALDAEVEWIGETQTVVITTKGE